GRFEHTHGSTPKKSFLIPLCQRGNFTCNLTSDSVPDYLLPRRIPGTSTIRIIPTSGGFSAARTSAWTICLRVNRPSRRALSRVEGKSSVILYIGSSASGH